MRICFTGPLLGFSGYGSFSRNFLKTLYVAGFDVVARDLKYDKSDKLLQIPPWMQETLEKPLTNIDVLIQATTMNVEAVPKPGILNGIYFFFETDRIPPAWVEKGNQFDFIMVPTREVAIALMQSGILKPILVIAPPFDMSIYTQNFKPLDIPGIEGRTVFYNICQLSGKKGIDLLLRAYYAAFCDMPDEVILILKTYIGMQDRTRDREQITNFINNIKAGCRIPVPKLPPVLPILDIMDDEEIYSLHKTGHCYVNSSRGEGWGFPQFEALVLGNTLISHNQGSFADWITEDIAMLYQALPTHVFNIPHSDSTLYTGVERFFEPSTTQMADLMRSFHLLRKGADAGTLSEENQKKWQAVLEMQNKSKESLARFNIYHVAPILKKNLEAVYDSWKRHGKIIIGEEKK